MPHVYATVHVSRSQTIVRMPRVLLRTHTTVDYRSGDTCATAHVSHSTTDRTSRALATRGHTRPRVHRTRPTDKLRFPKLRMAGRDRIRAAHLYGPPSSPGRAPAWSRSARAALPRRGLRCAAQPATALAERAIARVSSADAARVPQRTVPDPKSSPPPFGELSGGRHYRPGGCAPLPAPQRGASSGRTDSNCGPAPWRAAGFVKRSHPFSPVAQR